MIKESRLYVIVSHGFLPAVLSLFSFLLISESYAYQLTFEPRLTAELTYTDNLFLDSGDDPDRPVESDTYSLITPGFTAEFLEQTYGLSLSYDFGYTRYFDWDSLNSWSHGMEFDAWSQLSRHSRVELINNLVYTADPISDRDFEVTRPPDSNIPEDYTNQRNRQPYLTNYCTLSFSHAFGPDDVVLLAYSNGVRWDFGDEWSGDPDDRNRLRNQEYIRHTPDIMVAYWFDDAWGIETQGTFDYGDFENQPDSTAWMGRFRLSRRFSQSMTIYVQYIWSKMSFDSSGLDFVDRATDTEGYTVQQPEAGLEYSYDQHTTLTCSVGWVSRNMDNSSDSSGFAGHFDLNRTFHHGTLRLFGEAGNAAGVYTAEAVGPSLYFETGINGSYEILRYLGIDAFISFRRDKYEDVEYEVVTNERGDEDRYGAGAGISWEPIPWLSFSLNYRFTKVNSERGMRLYDPGYTENRGMLTITLTPERPWRTIR